MFLVLLKGPSHQIGFNKSDLENFRPEMQEKMNFE